MSNTKGLAIPIYPLGAGGVCPSPVKKRPLYVDGVDGYRISGAGAQNKLIVRLEAGRILLPLLAADLGQGRKRRG